jgi:hypothetical protein
MRIYSKVTASPRICRGGDLLSTLAKVDRLCINQAGIPERNQQVQIMRNICVNAGRVLIRSGKLTEESTMAIHLLEDLSGQYKYHIIFKPDAEPSPEDADLWRFVTDLIQRPFWSRGWIVQEITLQDKLFSSAGGVLSRGKFSTSHSILL